MLLALRPAACRGADHVAVDGAANAELWTPLGSGEPLDNLHFPVGSRQELENVGLFLPQRGRPIEHKN